MMISIDPSSCFLALVVKFLVLAIISSQFIQNADGFPFEAGHCQPGSLEGKSSPHGERGSDSLSNGSLQVLFDSTPLDPENPLFITANQEYSITLEFMPLSSSTSKPPTASLFKGFLFRLSGRNDESVDGTLYVDDDDKVQELTIGCASTISAMTHTNNDGKNKVEFKFQYFDEVVPTPISMVLEVTVMMNKEENNWFYDEYELEILHSVS